MHFVALAAAVASLGVAVVAQSQFSGPTGPIVCEKFEFDADAGNGQLMNAVTVDANSNLYVALNFGYAYCLSGSTGSNQWTYRSTDGSGLGQFVVASYGFSFLPTTRGVVAINSATGVVAWTWTDNQKNNAPSNLVLDPDIDATHTLYVLRGSSFAGTVTALNGETGQVYWTATTTGPSSETVVGNGQVSVGYPGLGAIAGSVSVATFSATTGAASWSVTLGTGKVFTQFLMQLDSNGHIIVGFYVASAVTVVSLAPAQAGGELWRAQPTMANPAGIIDNNNVYVVSQVATVAYALIGGTEVWTSNVGYSKLQPYPNLAVFNNMVFVVTGGLYTLSIAALSATSGGLLWSFQDPQATGVFGPLLFDASSNIFVETFSSSQGSTAYSISATTGTSNWQYSLDPTATTYYDTTPALGNGYLFLGNDAEVAGISNSYTGDCVPIPAPSNSPTPFPGNNNGLTGGQVAGAVMGSLIGVGGIAAAVWWFKFRSPGSFSSFASSLAPSGSKPYAAIGSSSGTSGAFNASSSTTAYTAYNSSSL